MADTLPNIKLTADVWVDLYAETGISVGTQIIAQNIGVCDVYLASQAAQPTSEIAHQIIKRSQHSRNDAGDAGAWAYCANTGGLVNVRLS